jgi:FolB domain-containing protein
MAEIHVKDLEIETIIGINDQERTNKQKVKINYRFAVDITKPAETDSIDDCVNYRTINKKVIEFLHSSSFYTLEKLTAEVLKIVMSTQGVSNAKVTVSKPGALRFTKDVSITMSSDELHE